VHGATPFASTVAMKSNVHTLFLSEIPDLAAIAEEVELHDARK